MDANALVILPFDVSGPPTEIAWLREGLVDLLSTSLDGVAGWRVVSPRTVLAQTRRVGDPDDVVRASHLARSLGAGGLIMGRAVATGPRLRVRAELYDATRGQRLTKVDIEGPTSEPGPLTDRLAVGLAQHRLARLGRGGLVREYATSSPQALRAYLAAEQLARRGALQAAADSLQAAIARDSAFGLAYSRLMIVTAFGSNLNLAAPSAEDLVAPALRLVERLPPRQRDILFATAALWQGKRVEALRLADALGQRYPDDADAAYAQGEIYFHFGLSVGAAPRVALEPFERAIRLDPELIEAYIHAIELRCVVGDTGQAWALLDSGLATAPRFFPFWAIQAAMRAGLRGEDPAALEPGLRGLASLSGLALIRASIEVRRVLDHDPARAIRVADAFVQLAAAPEQPHSLQAQAWRLGALFRLAQGRHREAWAAGHQALGLEPTSVAALAFTAVYPLITGREQNAGFLAQRDLRTAEPAAATLVIVAWAAREQRDSATYAFAVRALDSATAGRVVRDYTERRLAGLRGLGALQDGDTARARAQLEIASDASSQLAPFIETVPDIYFALRLARLERAAGAHDDALRRLYAMSLDNSGGLVYRAEAEELRGKIADERGDSAAAIRAYRNFIELWKDADPELQPRVAEARVALARLEGR